MFKRGVMLWMFVSLALALFLTAKAEAGKDEFEAFLRGMKTFYVCDGVPPPIKGDDYLGGNPDPLKIRADGLAACDAALADPALRPEFEVRRVSLLQGKALQLIGAGRSKEALFVLDEASAMQTSLTANQRSRGLNLANDALRAIALGDMGDVKSALATAQRMETARPFSTRTLDAALSIKFRLRLPVNDQIALLKRRAALDPVMGVHAMRLALLTGQPTHAKEIGSGLKIVEPIARKGWKSETSAGSILIANAEINKMLTYASNSIDEQKEIGVTSNFLQEEFAKNFSDIAEIYSKVNHIENDKNQIKYLINKNGNFIQNKGLKFIAMSKMLQYTVQFINKKSTVHSIDEYTLFSAAAFAKQNGYVKFIIEGRKFSSYTTNWQQGIGAFTLSGTEFKGDEVQLVIRLLKSNELPKDLVGSEWRIIEVEEVLRTLAPIGKP
jgi:hypothetical protein